jgi:hypothetical protein
MSKESRKPKAESRKPKSIRNSAFGFLSDFGIRISGFLFAFLLALSSFAAPFTGTPSGRILAAGNNRVMILSPDGEVLWQYPTKLTHDAWMLPSGNVLFADGESVTEVTPEKKVVFQYKAAEQKGGGTYACQRLANGNTLIGENSTGRLLEVDASGKVVFTLATSPAKSGDHHNMRMARKLDNGNYLVCHSGARLVKEYTPEGKMAWEVKAPGQLAFAAIRTTKNTTLVASLDQITEFDAQGGKVWEFSVKDAPGVTIQNLTGMHLLPNGNLVAGCYQAYRNGEGCGLLEISRAKQIVWHYTNPKSDTTMMSVQLLTADGKSLDGTCSR